MARVIFLSGRITLKPKRDQIMTPAIKVQEAQAPRAQASRKGKK
jgi:hypothetical protein